MNGFLLETKHKKSLSVRTYIEIHRDGVIINSVPEPSHLWLVVVQFVLKIVLERWAILLCIDGDLQIRVQVISKI